MNTPQSLYAIFLSQLPLITIANGYQRNYLSPPVKGIITTDNKFLRPMFFLENSNAVPKTEDESKGYFTVPIVVLIDFKVTAAQGNITDECEIILQDLIDWVSGTFGITKSLNIDWNTLGIQNLYIINLYRTFDWEINIGRCGIQINCIYEGKI